MIFEVKNDPKEKTCRAGEKDCRRRLERKQKAEGPVSETRWGWKLWRGLVSLLPLRSTTTNVEKRGQRCANRPLSPLLHQSKSLWTVVTSCNSRHLSSKSWRGKWVKTNQTRACSPRGLQQPDLPSHTLPCIVVWQCSEHQACSACVWMQSDNHSSTVYATIKWSLKSLWRSGPS